MSVDSQTLELVHRLQQELAEKDKMIAEKDKMIAEVISEKDKMIDKVIAEKDQALFLAQQANTEKARVNLEDYLAAFSFSTTPRRRDSLGAVQTPENVIWSKLGNHFRFVNREAQAKKLFEAFFSMELIRTNPLPDGRWELLKRRVRVPTCTGMPGVGKTRFARDAIHHLAEVHERKCNTSGKQDAASIIASAASAYEKDQERSSLFQSLIRASYYNCSLRVDCSLLCEEKSSIAKVLLEQWLGGTHLIDVPDNVHLTLYSVVQHILARTPKKELCEPSLLINVDEAHWLKQETLGTVLRQLLNLLVVNKLRVFVVVTGVTSAVIDGALKSSSMGALEISLPLLKLEHVQEIVQGFFPEIVTFDHILQHILWWVGGVPRFLQYMITVAAELCKENENGGARKPVADFLMSLNETSASGILDSLASMVYFCAKVSKEVLEKAFSYALLEMKVSGSFRLTREETVESAQENCQLYWKKIQGEDGIITLPPLVLYWTSANRIGRQLPPIHLFRYFVPFSTTRDEETLVVTVLMHKFKACSLQGMTKVKLSVLGLPHGKDDTEVDVPNVFSVERAPHKIEKKHFVDFLNEVRRKRRSVVAYVNVAQAAFADAFIILKDFVIFIQEKQRAIARVQGFQKKTVAKVSNKAVQEEYEKLGHPARVYPHAFYYVTDEKDGTSKLPPNAYVVSCDEHQKLLGTTCAYLRQRSFGSSMVDAAYRSDHFPQKKQKKER
jgi:hypothetical protein